MSLASPTTIDGLMSRENVTCVETHWALRSGESKYPERSCDGINETVSGNVSRQQYCQELSIIENKMRWYSQLQICTTHKLILIKETYYPILQFHLMKA